MDKNFMKCMARDALRRYPSKGSRVGYYQRLIKSKTKSMGAENAKEFVTELRDLMREEWGKIHGRRK